MDEPLERRLWEGWVREVCRRANIPPPTEDEWQKLRSAWKPGKNSLTSLVELVILRGK